MPPQLYDMQQFNPKVHLAWRDMRHRACPIVWGSALGVHLPVVKLSMILWLLILWCWRIPATLHRLIAVLWLSTKLLLSIGLLTKPWLGLSIALLVLLGSAAAATAARHQAVYFCRQLVHESSC